MFRLSKIKNSLLLLLGLMVGVAAILVGLGFVGGSSSKSSSPLKAVANGMRSPTRRSRSPPIAPRSGPAPR